MLALCALASLTALEPARVWGHGFSLTLTGNVLTPHSDDPPLPIPPEVTPNSRVFVETLEDVFGVLQTDAGGIGGGTAFIQGRHFSFDAFGPLWYSNGGDAVPAVGAKMTLVDQQAGFTGQQLEMTAANSGITTGFPISGRTSHEFIWKLTTTTANPLPDGVYGVLHRINGGLGTKENPGAPFDSSQWVLTALYTPGFSPDALHPNPAIDLAAARIWAAAVPEPASATLLAAGLVGAVGVALRRRKRNVSRGLRQPQSVR